MQPNATDKESGQPNTAFITNLQQLLQIINSNWSRISTGEWDWQVLEVMTREANELVTISAANHLADICETAKELEYRFRWIHNKGLVDAHDKRSISQHLESLKNRIFELKPNNIITLYPSSLKHESVSQDNDTEIRIGLLESDEDLSLNIKFQLEEAGYRVSIYNDPIAIAADMAEHKFHLVLADLMLPDCPLTNAQAVEEFLSNNPVDVPVVMLSQQDDLATRLIALRAGIKAYVTKPIEQEELLNKVKHIISKRNEAKLRVLVVDDDEMLTEYYDAALAEEGFIVNTINDPLNVLQAIDTFKPDVITLDYLMPGCNGLEVAEILRGDPRYMKIPLVFMSASEEATQRRGIMGIFGNAFLEKPVDIDRLNETLTEITAKTRKVKERIKKIAKRETEHHLENRDYFLNSIETHIQDPSLKENIEKNHYLVMANIGDIHTIRERLGSIASDQVEEKVESYFAKHPLIKGRGCRYDETNFLLLIEDDKKLDASKLFPAFIDEFKLQNILPETYHDNLSISLGVMLIEGATPTKLEECIDKVETASVSAAASGGNNFDLVQHETLLPNTEPNKKMMKALEEQRFQLAFQSIVKPDSDDHLFEALVRLEDEDGEIYTPQTFLPFIDDAIDNGHLALDRWVVQNAFETLEQTTGRGAAEFSIVIKLTPNLRHVEHLLPFIYNIISNTRLRGVNRIYFSVPEKAILADIHRANSIIQSLHRGGCGFIMEHCMANDRSIEGIHHLNEIDFVKLDPSLAAPGTDASISKHQIKSLQTAMKGKGHIIAGLVEDAKTFATYWDLDVRYFQGFFIHRPNSEMQYQPFEGESLVLDK